MLIKDHKTYTDFFLKMATHHVKIHHRAEQMRFVRMNLSAHPVLAREDIKEFLKAMRSKLHFPALLLNAYQSKTDAQDSYDAKRKQIMGEFFIVDRVKKEDFDHQDQVFDETDQIGQDILAFLGEYYECNPQEGIFSWSEASTEKISNLEVDNLAGTKFYFTISIPSEVALQLNADRFDEEIFDELS
jgi:hypothetical protein